MYIKLAKEVEKVNGRLYIVGGAIRDLYMYNKPISESSNIDIEIIGLDKATLEIILDKYGKWKEVGTKYKVYLLGKLEIKHTEFVKGEELKNKDYLEKVLTYSISKRDLTINSIYYDPLTKETLDLGGGINDIKNKTLRYNSREGFLEDPLRVLRSVELGGRLEFSFSQKLKNLIEKNFKLIRNIPKERIMLELEKILLTHKKPSKTFELLDSVGGVKYLFPYLEKCKTVIQDITYHPEGDVYTHTLMTLDVLRKEERELDIMIALLFHDIGKQRTVNSGFRGHNKISQDMFLEIISKFTNNKSLIRSASNLILYHTAPLVLMLNDKISKIPIRKIATKIDIEKLLMVYKADLLGRGKIDNSWELDNIEKIRKLYNKVKKEVKPIITGDHLTSWGYREKEKYKKILKYLHYSQLEEKFGSVEEGRQFLENSKYNL